MAGGVILRGGPDGVLVLAPEGAPTVADGTAPIDTVVLEVLGGHLTWGLLAGQRVAAAVLDDAAAAQDWIWAVYGEEIALAVADFDGRPAELAPRPVLPRLPAEAWRLGYAHWAARWWPASTLDGIAALDEALLDREIATLTAACESLVDGNDAAGPDEMPSTETTFPRAADYALAAGSGTAGEPLILARGSGGWDWRRCPPGLVDASEQAISWEVRRESGTTMIRVTAVAAPQLRAPVPAHLRPHALVRTPAGIADAELTLAGDTWTGRSAAPPGSESRVAVDIHVPGVGLPTRPGPGVADLRGRIRAFAARRLRHAAEYPDDPDDTPLLAELAAAADPDF
jgi:hypothetical protein